MQGMRSHYEPQRIILPLPELREHERGLVATIAVPGFSDAT